MKRSSSQGRRCLVAAGLALASVCGPAVAADSQNAPASASDGSASASSAPKATAAGADEDQATRPASKDIHDPSHFTKANPFAEPSTLAFQAPPFDRIKDSDFMPALDEGMRRESAEIQAIANSKDSPDFQNTIVAMQRSGRLLDRVTQVFYALTGANTDDTLQRIEQIEAPRLAAHQDSIYLNPRLFKRVSAVHDRLGSLKLDPESKRLVEKTYQHFVRAGARLSEADKTRLRDLNRQLSSLSTDFTQKLLAANTDHSPVYTDKSALAGLSADTLSVAGQAAADAGHDHAWLLSLQNTTQQPELADLADRSARKTLFEASWNRTEHGDDDDTRQTIETMARLRAEKAQLLGYPDYAAYALADQMAKTPDRALDFMHRLARPARAAAESEAADLQRLIDNEGQDFKLAPWDWNYYAEKLRKQRYDLDAAEIKPYFELNNVLEKGVFYAAHQLYGISFKERHDLPVYQPDVRVFTVFDADGSKLGLFYADYFKRDNKRGGAWMSNFVGQSTLLDTRPVVYNVANFTKPPAGQPALLSFDDVVTLFHEFGHALNGLFADTRYPMLSGTATPRDFVEFPSQFNEHWAIYPEVFAHYAKNYKTGQPMPDALKKRLMKSVHFNQGYDMSELISAALLDMAWHTVSPDNAPKDADAFETQALKQAGMYMPDTVPPRYRSSYFAHIWSGGYAAGYYAYLWTQMLADDGYAWFTEHGGLTRKNGDRFRRMVLSRGDTQDLETVYDDWRGRAPKIGPMLENRGLAGDSDTPPAQGAAAAADGGATDAKAGPNPH